MASEKCTLKALQSIIAETKPKINAWSGVKNSADPYDTGVNCHEVYPNIFISNAGCARNRQHLKNIDITHVFNTAEGNLLGQVNTSESYYSPFNMIYKGIRLVDLPQTRIYDFFYEGSEFISNAMDQKGKILVHCMMGLSRSATMVIAYLMIKKQMKVDEALKVVRSNRYVHPNNGFMKQLIELNSVLYENR